MAEQGGDDDLVAGGRSRRQQGNISLDTAALIQSIVADLKSLFSFSFDRISPFLENVHRFIEGTERDDAEQELIRNLRAVEDDIAACCLVLGKLLVPSFVEGFDNFQARTETNPTLYDTYVKQALKNVFDGDLKDVLQTDTTLSRDEEQRTRLALYIIVECENSKMRGLTSIVAPECKFEQHQKAVKFHDIDVVKSHLKGTYGMLKGITQTKGVKKFTSMISMMLVLLDYGAEWQTCEDALDGHRFTKKMQEKLDKLKRESQNDELSTEQKEHNKTLIALFEKKKLGGKSSAYHSAEKNALKALVTFHLKKATNFFRCIALQSKTQSDRLLVDAFLLWAVYYDAGSGTLTLQENTQLYDFLGISLKGSTATGSACVFEAARGDILGAGKAADTTAIQLASIFISSFFLADKEYTQFELLVNMLASYDDDDNPLVAEAPPPGNIVRTTHAYNDGANVYSGGWDDKTNTPRGHGTLSVNKGELQYEGEFDEGGRCNVTLVKGGPEGATVTYKGPFKDGTLTGKGGHLKAAMLSGKIDYIGEFEKGVLIKGDIRSADGSLRSRGTYDFDTSQLLNGNRYDPPGTLKEKGTFKDGVLIKGTRYDATGSVMAVIKSYTYKTNNTYRGEWGKDGSKPQGVGTLTIRDNTDGESRCYKFTGTFKEDGTCEVEDAFTGTRYTGSFENGQLTDGTMEGTFDNDKSYTDIGTFNANGSLKEGCRIMGNLQLIGTFQNDALFAGKKILSDENGAASEVHEKFTYDNGNMYEGEWNDAKKKPEGHGTLWLLDDGAWYCYKGLFKADGTCDVTDFERRYHYVGDFEDGQFTNGTLSRESENGSVLTEEGAFSAGGFLEHGTIRSVDDGTIHSQGRFENTTLIPGLKVPSLALDAAHWQVVAQVLETIPHRELACEAIRDAKAGAEGKFELPNLELYADEWGGVLAGLEGQQAKQAAATEKLLAKHARAAAAVAVEVQAKQASSQAAVAAAAAAAEEAQAKQAAAAAALNASRELRAKHAAAAAAEESRAEQLDSACSAIRVALGTQKLPATAEEDEHEATSWPKTISPNRINANKKKKRDKYDRDMFWKDQASSPPVALHDPAKPIILTPDDDGTGLNCHAVKDASLLNSSLYEIIKQPQTRPGKSHSQDTQEYTENWSKAALKSFKTYFKGDSAAKCRNGLDDDKVDAAFDDCGWHNIAIAHATLEQGANHRRAFFARINPSGIMKLREHNLEVSDVVCIVFAIGKHPSKQNNLQYQTLLENDVVKPGIHWQVESLPTKSTAAGPRAGSRFDGETFHFVNCAFADA